MKRCPRCNRTYYDEFAFCTEDGAVLSAPYDPQQTLVLPTPNHSDLPTIEASVSQTKSAGKRYRWNDISFFEDAVKHLQLDEVEKLRQLYEFSIECSDQIRWGTGPQRGTFNVGLYSLSPSKSLYTVYSDGNLDLNIQWLPNNETTSELINELAQRLKRLRGFDISSGFRGRFIRVRKEHWMPQISEFMDAVHRIFTLSRGI